MKEKLDNIKKPLHGATVSMGTIVGRVGAKKNQQGCFVRIDEDNDLELINVIDMNEGLLFASQGVLVPEEGDDIFYFDSNFKNSPYAREAMAILKEWALYKKNDELQSSIEKFVKTTFVPEQIVMWQQEDALSYLFVPIQQKFRIGRFKERRSAARICKDEFRTWLHSLDKGEHITYVAQIMHQRGYTPKFFSNGTRPHQVTESLLHEKEYNFKVTHAGHIRSAGVEAGKQHFLVDAGSNYIGRGAKAPLHIAKTVVKALKQLYPEFSFSPLEGRAAFGDGQSY